ncbi:hypothetical protein QBC47DRAFT_385066 [Echria macrotheca]|uniref:Ysc84 actin-binding domain-containing protein n=1 Tax=Echria macrotheca TaxID=438768 RepID=A0AAJ0B8W5_9PEZI|nr:hypothetical protein QBC47DRAFT_385066 [Echria macrotheca]
MTQIEQREAPSQPPPPYQGSDAQPPVPSEPPRSSGWQRQVKKIVETISSPLNSAATTFGLPSFAPLPVDRELARATSIFSSFTTPTQSRHETIPAASLTTAAGLVILTTGRLGLRRVSGSVGSGILVVRHPETREWCAPVAVRSYGAGAGPFAMGFEVTERVFVIPSHEALERFAKADYLFGAEAIFSAGSLGRGGGVSFAGATLGKSQEQRRCERCRYHDGEVGASATNNKAAGVRESFRHPIQCYMRSKGLYLGLQAEGLNLEERRQENSGFYGKEVSALSNPVELSKVETGLGEHLEPVKTLLAQISMAETGKANKTE